MGNWIKQLMNNEVGNVVVNEPLAKHTTWKIGGPADAFIEPKDMESLVITLKILKQANINWKVLGKGSNLLASDKGFRGAIISLHHESFQKILIKESRIHVGANYSLIRLANVSAKNGLTGLEFAGGIPGTVGGAIYMNAGAHSSDISRILQEAEVLNENGIIEKWRNEDFEFSYRSSKLQKVNRIILSAVFELKPGDRKKIAEDMARFKDRRRKTQPYNLPCSGSVFRNPDGDYAGRLIEELGLKGYKIGGAQISTIHANFIVNTGNAKAKDVMDLVHYIQVQVKNNYKIDLVPEVERIGEGN